MEKIKITKMRIENFKGCKNLEIDFAPTTVISGANATGKTTICDAFHWLLFGKDATGSATFDIRPLDQEGNKIDHLEIAVEAVLDVDGQEMTLRKTQKQNWVKKRGSSSPTFQGNVNSYEVDGFPMSEKQYKQKIAELVDEDAFRLMTDPRTFASLPWKRQREILTSLIPGITDYDIAAAEPEKYKPIIDDLQKAPAEKCLEKAKKALALEKKKQDEIPIRIDEAVRSIEDVPEPAELELEKSGLEEELDEIADERKAASPNEADKLRDKIMQAKFDISAEAAEATGALLQRRSELKRAIVDSKDGIKKADASIAKKQDEVEALTKSSEKLQSEREKLLVDWREAKAMEFDPEAAICQYCGQPLPDDQREKVREDFEAGRRREIERIEAAGARIKKSIDENKALIARLGEEIESLWQEAIDEAEKFEKAQTELDTLPEKPDMSQNQNYQSLCAGLADLENQLDQLKTPDGLEAALDAREADAKAKLFDVQRLLSVAERNQTAADRVEELGKELRDVAQKAADQERIVDLLEELLRKKAEMFSSEVGKLFDLVDFKLFDVQVNGGLKETCEMTVGGVPYGSLNGAGKIMAGLDVIKTLQKHHGSEVPVWLDNAESINNYNIPEMPGQLILLQVTDDKVLCVGGAS